MSWLIVGIEWGKGHNKEKLLCGAVVPEGFSEADFRGHRWELSYCTDENGYCKGKIRGILSLLNEHHGK